MEMILTYGTTAMILAGIAYGLAYLIIERYFCRKEQFVNHLVEQQQERGKPYAKE